MTMTGRIVPSSRREPERPSAGLPLLGRLKCGVKVKGPKGEYPQSVDYFVPHGKYAAMFTQVYGERPDKVSIVFLSDEPADVCSERFVVRDKAGKLLAEGDGESWRVWSGKKQTYVFLPKPGATCTVENVEALFITNPEYKGSEIHIELTLSFVLLGLPSLMGVWQVNTRAVKSSIPQIRNTFDLVRQEAGFIRNIPFDLVVEKHKSNKPGKASVYPVISLIPNVSKENLDQLHKFVESGVKIRGLLTNARISAQIGGEDVDDYRPASERPAIAAQTVLPVLPAAADENYGGTEADDEPQDATETKAEDESQESLFTDVDAPAEEKPAEREPGEEG